MVTDQAPKWRAGCVAWGALLPSLASPGYRSKSSPNCLVCQPESLIRRYCETITEGTCMNYSHLFPSIPYIFSWVTHDLLMHYVAFLGPPYLRRRRHRCKTSAVGLVLHGNHQGSCTQGIFQRHVGLAPPCLALRLVVPLYDCPLKTETTPEKYITMARFEISMFDIH